MATVSNGGKKVLMVVDVQVGVVREAFEAARIIGNIARAVEKAREQQTPVIWVQHASDDLTRESDAWQIVPELSPAESEPLIHKQFNSSFEKTSLEETLKTLNADHIVLAGAMTNWCIRATAYGALERGYDLTLIKDAHTTKTIELEKGVNIEADQIIRELNIAMNWLDYPDRSNQAVSVDEVDFAPAKTVGT